jgi:hypothetical protein
MDKGWLAIGIFSTMKTRLVSLVVATVLLGACQSAWPAVKSTALPAPGSNTGLEGAYRWISLDGKDTPLEFPLGSGTMLVYGTLDVRNVNDAQAGSGGGFAMRFTVHPRADTARVTGEDGKFVLRGDSLLFTPNGRESSPPVRFRYAFRSNGQQLALTDADNHVWVYVRR